MQKSQQQHQEEHQQHNKKTLFDNGKPKSHDVPCYVTNVTTIHKHKTSNDDNNDNLDQINFTITIITKEDISSKHQADTQEHTKQNKQNVSNENSILHCFNLSVVAHVQCEPVLRFGGGGLWPCCRIRQWIEANSGWGECTGCSGWGLCQAIHERIKTRDREWSSIECWCIRQCVIWGENYLDTSYYAIASVGLSFMSFCNISCSHYHSMLFQTKTMITPANIILKSTHYNPFL